MFGIEKEELLKNLEKLRAERCCYMGITCDCKFGMDKNKSEEQTGCPELRQATALIKAMDKKEWNSLKKKACIAIF
jgi:hypothetical protein